jgi:transketolase
MTTRFENANAIRALSMDAVQKANSGHPGMPMGMADIAEVLWNDYLSHDPGNPDWFNRDRFILSNGHGSMLLYSVLHLSGYADMTLDQIKNFRQLHSKTAGHPEYKHAHGIECTTGPLGQGLGMSVGFAIAERLLASTFNRDGFPLLDHYTYVFAGDGCLMEGISHEACSLAGTLGLGKLIVFYDDNGISIDGHVSGWFRDDTPGRFEAYGWQVVRNVNGHDPHEIKLAIDTARGQVERPTLICCKTVIGFGSPNKEGTQKAHGAALGVEEVKLAREKLGWPYPAFEIPAEIYAAWDARAKGAERSGAWNSLFEKYAAQYPQEAAELRRRISGKLPESWAAGIAGRHAQELRSRAECDRCAAAGAGRRLRRPDRVEQHPVAQREGADAGRGVRQLRRIRRARVRHGLRSQRHGAARRTGAVRRDLSGVLRLLPQCAAAVGTDARALDLRVHARLDRPRRRRPDPSAGRAYRLVAPDSAYACLASGRCLRDRHRLESGAGA